MCTYPGSEADNIKKPDTKHSQWQGSYHEGDRKPVDMFCINIIKGHGVIRYWAESDPYLKHLISVTL